MYWGECEMEKILSISIAAYNAEKDIAKCLDSLVKSEVLEQLDVIVVNDGSKDKTAEIVSEYVKQYGVSIRLINKENGGHGSTINTSIKYAVGKYYKILDSDDWVDSKNLERLVRDLAEINTDMVLNPYIEVDYRDYSNTRLLEPDKTGILKEQVLDINKLTSEITLYMHSLTFNTSVIQQMGSIIDENCFYVDMEYCVFPLLYVKSFVSLEYPIYQYLLGSQTQSMNNINLIKRRNQHLKVTKRLIRFYNQNSRKINKHIAEIMITRIKYAIYQQYKIYLSMSAKEALNEIKEFDEWLKNESYDLYQGPTGCVMKFIKFNRNSNYRFYGFLINFAKVFNLIK